MTKYIIFIPIVITILIIFLYMFSGSIFQLLINGSNFEKENATFNQVQKLLAQYDSSYHFQIQPLNGGSNYKVLFEKGIDHICIVRVDGAELVIQKIINSNYKQNNVNNGGLQLLKPNWYYDCREISRYERYDIDQFNYYIIDKLNKIVWYVQYST